MEISIADAHMQRIYEKDIVRNDYMNDRYAITRHTSGINAILLT